MFLPIKGAAMRLLTSREAGLAVTLGAVVTAVVAFPAISKTASEQRFEAVWQEKAETLYVPEVQVSSAYAERLASLHVGADVKSSFERDYALTNTLVSYRSEDLQDVKFHVAEKQCLAEAIYYEARSESRAGQKAVGEVILNRVASKHFPSTICDVVYQGSERRTGCQFTFTCDGSMDITPKGRHWKNSQDMAELVMTSGFKPLTNRATHYHTTAVKPVWSDKMRMTRRVGSHVFYRFAPRNYVPSSPTIAVAPPI